MNEKVREIWVRAVVAGVLLSLAMSLPLMFTYARAMIALLDPELLLRWQLVARICWAASGVMLGSLILWLTRTWWAPVLWRATRWLLRQVWRLVVALWYRTHKTASKPSSATSAAVPAPAVHVTKQAGSDCYPPLDLLGPPVKIEVRPCPEGAQQLKAALAALGVPGCEVLRHFQGPVVKAFEIRPPEDTKASAIRRLGEDLAARLGAQSVIIDPVIGAPGVLSVHVAGSDTTTVPLRALMDSEVFHKAGALPIVVGVDPTGRPLVGDLATMPHLLIGGTTGAGKSWFIRQLTVSLLYRLSPEELRLIMIDPKQVEFALYKGLPHLLRPIITKPAAANNALQALVEEMERRYTAFEEAGVTGLAPYNKQHPKQRLPYIAVFVDELADLMEAEERDEMETAIQRLGQKARACGIHLVLATQRPSVNVITGTIKAVIPARVSLRVVSLHDSRTIIDVGGSERLRDRGDFFFRPVSTLLRGQAAAVPDELLSAVVAWWRRPGQVAPPAATQPPIPTEQVAHTPPTPPEGSVTATPQPAPAGSSQGGGGGHVAPAPGKPRSELDRAKELALEVGVISRRMMAQRLSVGSSRAQELVENLASRGWLRPAKGPRPREVTFGVTERRQMLSAMRGCKPEDVVLVDPPSVDSEPDDVVDVAGGAVAEDGDLKAIVADLDRTAQEACGRRNPDEMLALIDRLGRLMEQALTEEDAPSYHALAAARRSLKDGVKKQEASA